MQKKIETTEKCFDCGADLPPGNPSHHDGLCFKCYGRAQELCGLRGDEDRIEVNEHGMLLVQCPSCKERGFKTSADSENWLAGERFDFGTALRLLKLGFHVAREGWNGRGMYLFLAQVLSYQTRMGSFEPDLQEESIRLCIFMFDAQDKEVPGWLASQTDMLAEDWTVVS